MASILDQWVGIAEQTSYTTTQTTANKFRGYESTVDGWERNPIYLDGGGRRKGAPGLLASRRLKAERGATGNIESAVLSEGEGTRLAHLLGAKPSTPSAVNGVYTTTYALDSTGPAGSYTVLIPRADLGGTLRTFEYSGVVPTGFTVSVEQGGLLMLSVDYDASHEEVLATTPSGAPVYPGTSAIPSQLFLYENCQIKIGGSSVSQFKSFDLTVDLGMDTELFILGSGVKRQPVRSQLPTVSGTLSAYFRDLTEFNRFANGDKFRIELEATSVDNISSTVSNKASFKVDIKSAIYTGNSPASSLDSVTMIDLPYDGLVDGSNEILEIETKSGIVPFL